MEHLTRGTIAGTGSLGANREDPSPSAQELGEWMDQVAARIQTAGSGEFLAYRDGTQTVVAALEREWTRVGRSLAADVRFDDSTVSRRHALIVRQADGVRVLDDRSLNGVFVNGERVECKTLDHGDEIRVGRYRLYYLDGARLAADRRAGSARVSAAG